METIINTDLTAAQIAEHTPTAERILTPELAARFEAARVFVPAVKDAILSELAKGRTEEDVAADLANDIETFEKAKADGEAKQAEAEAEAAKQNRRVEVLSVASILLGHLVAEARPDANQAHIVQNTVNLAEALVDAVDKRFSA